MCVVKLIYVSKMHTYIPTHVCIRTNIQLYIYTCACMHACTHIHTNSYMVTYMRAYIHPYIDPSLHTYVHTCIHTYMHAYILITSVTRTFVYVEISVIFTQITRIIIYFHHFRFSKDKYVSMQMKPYIPSKEWYICFASKKINE